MGTCFALAKMAALSWRPIYRVEKKESFIDKL
jgi:hypothetical protein